MSSDSSVSDYCRFCTISFKVKFGSNLGKQGDSSSENLFRLSKRKECFGAVLAEICIEVGLPFVHSMQYSGRDCNPCGRKIRKLGQVVPVHYKLQLHPRQVPWLRAANVLLKRRTKSAQHGENQNPPVSIHGQRSHPGSKVSRRLLKANQESLSQRLGRASWRKATRCEEQPQKGKPRLF